MKEKEWEGKGNITCIKIRTNENMFYTLNKLYWDELAYDENSETFDSMEEYVKYLTSKIMQDVINLEDTYLLYLHCENRVINKNEIKDIFVETYKPLQKIK